MVLFPMNVSFVLGPREIPDSLQSIELSRISVPLDPSTARAGPAKPEHISAALPGSPMAFSTTELSCEPSPSVIPRPGPEKRFSRIVTRPPRCAWIASPMPGPGSPT